MVKPAPSKPRCNQGSTGKAGDEAEAAPELDERVDDSMALAAVTVLVATLWFGLWNPQSLGWAAQPGPTTLWFGFWVPQARLWGERCL